MSGSLVGTLTGFFGVGGGFVIVPGQGDDDQRGAHDAAEAQSWTEWGSMVGMPVALGRTPGQLTSHVGLQPAPVGLRAR